MQKNVVAGMLADVYAVLGNALLTVPSDPELPYLEPATWEGFPVELSNEDIAAGLEQIGRYLAAVQGLCDNGREKTSLEFTKLFVGPPSPAAAPWESLNRGGEDAVGYGKPALEMVRLLEGCGLEVSNENNQYPDHMGIELLFLSYLCAQQAAGAAEVANADVCAFMEDHPLGWVAALRGSVEEAYSDGFYAGLLLLVEGTLRWHRDALDAENAA
ncbi:MAG: molecular chaperone TorD family protein [Gordonibacter sp.]|uniref:TorD/DmsD family molecular chaperone n=1 Tax=Gordonibacter sp. TaxID=1968902 RepID=UPI002FC742BC